MRSSIMRLNPLLASASLHRSFANSTALRNGSSSIATAQSSSMSQLRTLHMLMICTCSQARSQAPKRSSNVQTSSFSSAASPAAAPSAAPAAATAAAGAASESSHDTNAAPPHNETESKSESKTESKSESQPEPEQKSSAQQTAPPQPPQQPPKKQEGRRSPGMSASPFSWKSFFLTAATGFALLTYYNYEKQRQQTKLKPIEMIGRAAIGGKFELRDQHGATVTSDQIKGEYVLLYFGFTHCPDICPTELVKMNEALDKFESQLSAQQKSASGSESLLIRPVFISIDPARDTVARMHQYATEESPVRSTPRAKRMMWLTGDDEAVRAAAKAYRVYFSVPDHEEGDDYNVDHSIFFYLLDRQGQVLEYYAKSLTSQEVADKIKKTIAQDLQK